MPTLIRKNISGMRTEDLLAGQLRSRLRSTSWKVVPSRSCHNIQGTSSGYNELWSSLLRTPLQVRNYQNMATSATPKLIGERSLHQAADPHLVAYCPSMELLALGTTDRQVILHRLNGQRVYSTAQKGSSIAVDRICWKPNGQLLAIAWSDGVVRLVGAESNKTVHQINTAFKDNCPITCLGWVSNFTDKRARRTGPASHKLLWKDTASLDSIKRSALDLPRDLGLIDIESSLPKLSALPAGGTSEDIFSSRASLDGLFRAFDPKDNESVDVMVIGTKDGQVHLSIYDSFIVGSFPSPLVDSITNESNAHMVLHASHKNHSTHGFLMSSNSDPTANLYFVPMDLRFISASSEYLSLLASKSTSLQNILRYIRQVQTLMTAEWQTTQDLPQKFQRGINETLKKINRCDIVQAMYHSVATGHTFPAVREWLVDEVSERGHKRWDKAVTSGLENLRKLVHEDMLPALERCALILSRLAGVVDYQDPNDTMGFSRHQIEVVMETLACLNLASTKILTYVIDEIDLFAAFSTWIRHEIDRLVSDSSSTPSDEMLEKESIIDHSKVLLYIQTAMTTSPLAVFFGEEADGNDTFDIPIVQHGDSVLNLLEKQLKEHEAGLQSGVTLARLDHLCKRLGQQATAVFSQIAEAEKRNVRFGQPLTLSSWNNDGPLSMRIFSEVFATRVVQSYRSIHTEISDKDIARFKVYVALTTPGGPKSLRIFSVSMKVQNGISSQDSALGAALLLDGLNIKDFAFLENGKLLVLYFSKEERPGLLVIPCQLEDAIFLYSQHDDEISSPTQNINDILDSCGNYYFPEGDPFIPDKFEVKEMNRSEAQLESTRVCVLDRSRLHYKVFTMPKGAISSIVADDDILMS